MRKVVCEKRWGLDGTGSPRGSLACRFTCSVVSVVSATVEW